MMTYIYKTDFADLSQSLREQLVDTIIERKFYRGDYKDLDNELDLVKTVEDAKTNLHVREDIEDSLNVDIVIKY